MSNDKQLIVRVRVIIGEEAYDANQKPLFKSHVMPLHYDRLEWYNFLKNANRLFGNAKIEKIQEEHLSYDDGEDIQGKKIKIRKTEYVTVDTPESIEKELKAAFGAVEVELTADQKQIAKLKDQMAKLIEGTSPKDKAVKKEVVKESTPESDKELEAARKKYHEVLKKKPNHLMKVENINKAIEEELNKK